ncbi:MAG TPA: hypothetical protein VKB31_04565 [Trueperaceae bacterium]|nr:hypothetical protein [Trueperaceae bacterium]
MKPARTGHPAHRGLLVTLALATLLAAVPLPRLRAAVHDPARSGAGMGIRVPLLLETGARLGTPGPASGLLRLPALPALRSAAAAPLELVARAAVMDGGPATLAMRLVRLGRLQLEGG